MGLEEVAEDVAGTAGLWRDPTWTPNMPGVYALIVGVSAYPHLAGGSNPAPETHGLEQLVSSASTAAQVFEWLRDSYQHEGLPVVWCQLLLSPTEAERQAFAARGLHHYQAPTNGHFRDAIQLWTGHLPQNAAAARKSRSFFFFSGHGVHSNGKSLLLPSDYLDPKFLQPHYENCISASELFDWMTGNPVNEHLALVDACRNEFSPLASKGASAQTVFPINPPGGRSPTTAVSLASTSPNTFAFQLPGRSLTFFGKALLEGLHESSLAGQSDEIELLELIGYVQPRINELLKELGDTSLDQTVRQKSEGDLGLIVTELTNVSFDTPRGPHPRGRGRTSAAIHAVDSRFTRRVEDPLPLSALATSPGEAHRRFGHEHASNLWVGGVRLYSLPDGRVLEGTEDARVVAVERNEESSVVRVDLSLAPHEGGVLMVFEGADVQRGRLAVPLPTDEHARVPIRLTLTIARQRPDEWPRLQKLDARLGPPQVDPGSTAHEHYAYLWSLSREADLGSLVEAARRADLRKLVEAAGRTETPSAALACILLLARTGRIHEADDTPRDLMSRQPLVPDGAVLWAESRRHAWLQRPEHPLGPSDPLILEAARALEVLAERGMPFFADAFELVRSLARWLSREGGATHAGLAAKLAAQLEQAEQAAMPAGHFMVYAGRPRPTALGPGSDVLSVEEILRIIRSTAS